MDDNTAVGRRMRLGTSVRACALATAICTVSTAVGSASIQQPTSARSYGMYVVHTGDTLWDIARECDTSVSVLYKLNRLTGSLIREGQRLRVPRVRAGAGARDAGSTEQTGTRWRNRWAYRLPTAARIRRTHRVSRGETLSGLALQYTTTVGLIQGANRLRSDLIRAGQLLTIPKPSDARAVSRSWPGNYDHNVWTLARIIYAEARGESYEGQVAVGAVILNRVNSSRFPKTIEGVVKEPRAFTAVADGQFRMHPSSAALRAAQEALEGWDPTHGALYYFNPSHATAAWSIRRPRVKTIGRHIFTV